MQSTFNLPLWAAMNPALVKYHTLDNPAANTKFHEAAAAYRTKLRSRHLPVEEVLGKVGLRDQKKFVYV